MTAYRRAAWGGRILPLGRETRYVAWLYGQRALVFLGVALAIVLSLDVATNLRVAVAADQNGVDSIDTSRLAFYIMLRAGYVLPSLLPIASIVGVFWTEFTLTASRERQMISGSGRSPLKALFPALIFGLCMGAVNFVAAAYVRPAAVEGQAVNGLRYYGSKFTGSATSAPFWFNIDGTVIHGRVGFSEGVHLRDLSVFLFDEEGEVTSMTAAKTAQPGPGSRLWTLRSGSFWDVGALRERSGALSTGLQSVAFQTLQMPLLLDPLWVENFDITPSLLDHSTLTALALDASGVPNHFSFLSALSERFANIVYCVGMALLGAMLALLRFAPGMNVARILGVIAYGGVAYVSSSAFGLLSAFGNIHPAVGPWIVPCTLALGSAAVLLWKDRSVFTSLAVLRQTAEG